jgi:peptidoglycan/LPS O-acetylase OafA/YrhL
LNLKRFYVIDGMRAVLALCVAIGHSGTFPIFGPVGHGDVFWDILARASRSLVFGPPAVIAFFVISGFCIHYPFVGSKNGCPIGRFYARRYIRIFVPVISAVALFKIFFPQTIILGVGSILWHSTLWSVLCEEIYYAVYPLLNRMRLAVGWPVMLKVAFGASILVSWYHFSSMDWQDIGIIATAVTLLPVWLMGCCLAENVSSLKQQPSKHAIWLWRFGAWCVMWLALLLHFHSSIHQTQSGLVVGVIYFFWIRAEISHYKGRAPWQWLVWAGGWSYSLYLIHPIIIGWCFSHDIVAYNSRLDWGITIAAILAASYAFYLLVEWPSHKLARLIPLFRREQFEPRAAIKGPSGALSPAE